MTVVVLVVSVDGGDGGRGGGSSLFSGVVRALSS